MARGSLADQLAELSNAAPADDYEDDFDALDAGRHGKVKANGAGHGASSDDDHDDDDEDGEDAARSHARHTLVDVGPSRMRKRANIIEGFGEDGADDNRGLLAKKYANGVATTRRQMMGDSDDGSDSGSMEHGESVQGSGAEDVSSSDLETTEDAEENYDDKSLSGESAESMEDQQSDGNTSLDDEKRPNSLELERRKANTSKQLRFADEAGQPGLKDVDESTQAGPSSPRAKTSTPQTAAEADAALLSDLRQRTREDAARGRDTRRALDAWAKLLGIRIRGQKVVRQAGRMHATTLSLTAPALDAKDRENLALTLTTLDQLSAQLFMLQRKTLESLAATTEAPSTLPDLDFLQHAERSRKRKLDNVEFDTQVSTALRLHAQVFGPLWRDSLNKWSWRTSSSSLDDSSKAKNRFDKGSSASLKAMNQSAEDQITRGMSGDAFERLLKRTRVWRGADNEARIIGADSRTVDNEDTDEPSNNAGQAVDADVFDDSDFYSALLRELIDNRGVSSAHGATSASSGGAHYEVDAAASAEWAQAARRAAKKHRAGVDHKASKGRRLRYDVHEKLENFMPPIPRETWGTEQIDRLVRHLRGGYVAASETRTEGEAEEASKQQQGDIQLGGLRLFG